VATTAGELGRINNTGLKKRRIGTALYYRLLFSKFLLYLEIL
jgi:hypothetical protein